MFGVDNILLRQQKKENEKNKILQKRLGRSQFDKYNLPEKKLC